MGYSPEQEAAHGDVDHGFDEALNSKEAATARADVLLPQLVNSVNNERPLPAPAEMAATALRALALPEIAALRPSSFPNWQYGQLGMSISLPDAARSSCFFDPIMAGYFYKVWFRPQIHLDTATDCG